MTRPPEANAVVAYDPEWPVLFDRIRAAITPSIADTTYELEHVGSTSVPGLDAKPIIDAHVAVPAAHFVADAVERLVGLGYTHQGNGDIEGREVLKPPTSMPYHHMYVVITGTKPHLDHVLLREYLRANPEAANQYAQRKHEVAHLITPESRQAYVEAKAAVVEQLIEDSKRAARLNLRVEQAGRESLPPRGESAFLLDGLTPSDRVWYGFVGSALVGGMKVTCEPGRTGADLMPPHIILDSLSVETAFRRRGCGRALMQFVHSWLIDEQGMPNTISLGVDPENLPAIRLYESLGYQHLVDHQGRAVATGNGARIMWLTLA
jgi:GrpB-like predicted nucleotidyltransferase (UPF0157 family)